MITPIIKLVPEKRPRFRLRTVFSGGDRISDASSFILDPFIKPLLIAESELVGCWVAYSLSSVIGQELVSKGSVSTKFS